MNAMHRELIEHEAGHAIAGMLAGLRVHRVHAPPPPDVPPADLDRPAGVTEFERSGDRRALAVALLGGPLAEGKPAPSWPIKPTRYSHDERELAQLVNETNALTYAEIVRHAEELLESDEFVRMHMVVCELLSHEPYSLSEEQLQGIKAVTMQQGRQVFPTRVHIKAHDDEPDDSFDWNERDELGVLSDRVIDATIRQMKRDGVYDDQPRATLDSSNGHRSAKALDGLGKDLYNALSGLRVEVAEFDID
jgi:hypothetical protein